MENSPKGSTNENQPKKIQCLYCGQQAPVVWVHGHGQCAACGINVDECCRGEQCFSDHQKRAG